jgi:NADH dehydrogenase
METDITGTQNVIQAAVDAGVDRFFYISHLGADRSSAYPVFKAKAIAEEYLRRSGLDYTILRTAIVFGPGDGLTTGIARLLYAPTLFFIIPGDGSMLIQPLWIEDLVTCLTWALDDDLTRRRTIEIGGSEALTFRQVVESVIQACGINRRIIGLSPGYLRWLTVALEGIFPGLPVSQYWMDYLAVNRTCDLDSVPRTFGLLPSRFSQRLDYLKNQNWRSRFWRDLWRRNKKPVKSGRKAA